MSTEDLVSSLFVLAPGFVALKLFQLFGSQWKRTDWEWVIWSLIAGLLISLVVAVVGITVFPPQDLHLTPDVVISTAGVPERFVVAALLGIVLVAAWRLISASRFSWLVAGRRRLESSAWDLVLQEAADEHLGVELALQEGDAVERYSGALHTFAKEADGAEGWIYLTRARQYDGATKSFLAIENTKGLLIHRENLLHVRIASPRGAGTSTPADRPPLAIGLAQPVWAPDAAHFRRGISEGRAPK